MAVPFTGYFYDIESLDNVFTLVNSKFSDKTPNDLIIDVYYLLDEDQYHIKSLVSQFGVDKFHKALEARIRLRNPNLRRFNVTFNYFDLDFQTSREHLATEFGITTSDDVCADVNGSSTDIYNNRFRIACDTDNGMTDYPDYYLFGYNSDNYDTTMIALLFNEITSYKKDTKGQLTDSVTARTMRNYNNALFEDNYRKAMSSYLYKDSNMRQSGQLYAHKMRKNMLRTGRHIDVAKLNEKQQHVALKRLLGMLGYQILESDKLKNKSFIENIEELLELLAYNVSDTVNLRMLFLHRAYKAQFDLKRSLIYEYKDIVYQSFEDSHVKSDTPYKPCISPSTVRKDRKTPSSSSAQLSTCILCPYGELPDLPAVSFMFPDKSMEQKLGIKSRNILTEAQEFFNKNFPQPELRAKFQAIVDMYREIEGKNYNDAKIDTKSNAFSTPVQDEYKYGQPSSLKTLKSTNTLLPYFDKDGNPTSCFVIFSTGGIHGAEYNKVYFEHCLDQYNQKVLEVADQKARLNFVKAHFKDDPKAARTATYTDEKGKEKQLKTITYIDGTELKLSEYAKYTKKTDSYSWKEVSDLDPFTWTKTDESTAGPNTKLNTDFTYTSADKAVHEDFTSYYPMLLMAMAAFYNPQLGEDRYTAIFNNKTLYGKYMKDPNKTPEEREYYGTARGGTKLILNSASGAGDANFDSAIKMNNRIISMRIIGQLFSWMIGQAQAIAGARVPSTNTDGLYTADLEESINNKILFQTAANIGVAIEPETMYLITKDSNNRIEYTFKNNDPMKTPDGDFDWSNIDSINTSGGDLGCADGPDPTKSLAHPAIIDWVLTRYLIVAASGFVDTVGLDKPFDYEYAKKLIMMPIPKVKCYADFLKYFQTIIASSDASMSYPFAYTSQSTIDDSNTTWGYNSYDNAKNNGDVQLLQKYNRIFVMKDNTPDCVFIQKASFKKLTPATITKRKEEAAKLAKTGGCLPSFHNPLAKGILNDNGVDDLYINKYSSEYDASVVKINGLEPEWSLRIDNRDLFELSDAEVADIVNNLDLDKYVNMIADKFTSNWFNKT